jgi:hypothetical protein
MNDHPKQEREAVKTTIVGGRPPGSGRENGAIPRGVEVLVKKAAVDPEFRAVLLEKRAAAADAIGLELTDSEKAMIGIVPERQLDSIIAHTDVPDTQRRAFMGRAAVVMLAALGTGLATAGCMPAPTGVRPETVPATDGIRPDIPQEAEPKPPPPKPATTKGIRPDVPKSKRPPSGGVSRGVRPDIPPSPPPPRPPAKQEAQPKTPKKEEPSRPQPDIGVSLGIRPR